MHIPMCSKRHAQQLRPERDVFALDRARKALVLHLLLHARDLDIGNRPGRLHQRAGGQESCQLVAGKQSAVQVRLRRHARVVCMRQERVQDLLRPALFAQEPHPDKRVLRGGRVPFVVHIVQ